MFGQSTDSCTRLFLNLLVTVNGSWLFRLPREPVDSYTWQHHSNHSVEIGAHSWRIIPLAVSDNVRIGVQACAEPVLNLLVFADKASLKKWEKRVWSVGEAVKFKYLIGCDAPSGDRYTIKVSEGSIYYLVLENSQEKSARVRVSLSLFQVREDIRNAPNGSATCNISSECKLPVAYNSEEVPVLSVQDTRQTPGAVVVNFTWWCEPRVWMYVAVFGGCCLPGVLRRVGPVLVEIEVHADG